MENLASEILNKHVITRLWYINTYTSTLYYSTITENDTLVMFTYTTEPNVNIHDKVSKRVHLTRCDKTTGKNQNI